MWMSFANWHELHDLLVPVHRLDRRRNAYPVFMVDRVANLPDRQNLADQRGGYLAVRVVARCGFHATPLRAI